MINGSYIEREDHIRFCNEMYYTREWINIILLSVDHCESTLSYIVISIELAF